MTDKLEMPIEQFAKAVAKENARLTKRNKQLEATQRGIIEAWDFWQNQETHRGFSELFASICEARSALEKSDV